MKKFFETLFVVVGIVTLVGVLVVGSVVAVGTAALRSGVLSLNVGEFDFTSEGKAAAEKPADVSNPEGAPDHVYNISVEFLNGEGETIDQLWAKSWDGEWTNGDVFSVTDDGYAVEVGANATIWFDPTAPANWQYRADGDGETTNTTDGEWMPLTDAAINDGYGIWLSHGGWAEFRYVGPTE